MRGRPIAERDLLRSEPEPSFPLESKVYRVIESLRRIEHHLGGASTFAPEASPQTLPKYRYEVL